MSSDEAHAALNQKLAAKFEELYTSRGNPTELDDAFVKEYFSVLDDNASFSNNAPKSATAHFGSSPGGSLLHVDVAELGVFFVRSGEDLLPIKGRAAGRASGKCGYTVESTSHFRGHVQITIVKPFSNERVIFISDKPAPVIYEGGTGQWLRRDGQDQGTTGRA